MALSAGWLAGLMLAGMPQDPNALENRVEQTLRQLTVDEKISLIGGVEGFYVRGIPRLNLPKLKMSDGPVGVRNYGPTTAYPATLSLASAFDPTLAERFGESIARDARSRGVHIWLAPGVNLARVPQNGRNFEYLGEDPLVAGKIATGIIRGVQSGGVVATVKHYAGNEHESDRNRDNSVIDERTLRELYLKPFEMAVKEGNVMAVMSSYNLVNGHYASANKVLVQDILKGEWGFKGIYMSDWGAAHETEGTFKYGLDLEMPGPDFMNPGAIKPKLASGEFSMADLDDKVRRILRVTYAMKFDQRPQEDPSIPKADPQNEAVALEIARRGVVLLKNEGNTLPFRSGKVKKIVVLGQNAGLDALGGGGSGYTTPTRYLNLVDALKDVARSQGATVRYFPGVLNPDDYFRETPVTHPTSGKAGWQVEYFDNKNLEGSPKATTTDEQINHRWRQGPVDGVGRDNFSARWTATYRAKQSGDHLILARSDDGVRVLVDGKPVINSWNDRGVETDSTVVKLQGGRDYRITVEYYQAAGEAEVRFGIRPGGWSFDREVPADALKQADVVVVATGFNQRTEGEGFDRSFDLAQEQQAILTRAQKFNPNVVVVNYSGGPVNLAPFIDKTKALVQAWYPGMNGNQAVAEILYGKTNPTGRLPYSWPKALKGTYYETAYPPKNNTMVYREGLGIGYRWFDGNRAKPLFPFGFGLSYAKLAIEKPTATLTGDTLRVTATVRNPGSSAGREIVQVYTGTPQTTVPRPLKELRGFQTIVVEPGKAQTVTLDIPVKSLAYWDVQKHGWVVPKGDLAVWVGSSSVNLSKPILLKVK